MDDDLLKLETELSTLRPAPVSPGLEREIDHALAPSREPRRLARWTWWAIPAAAALAIIAATATPRSVVSRPLHRTAAAPTFKPVFAENVLLSSRDEGYVTLSDGTPARRVRQTYVDLITWKNPQTNASLTWSLPREEVRVIPILLQ